METLLEFLNGDLLGFFLKLFGIVVGLLYVFFAFIITRQVRAMERVLTLKDNGLLRLIANIQLILALLVVGYALVIL